MSDPGDQYQPFIDAIRAADQELSAAIRTVDWVRIDRARGELWHAMWRLYAYIVE
jgi:hypothetical protein